MKEKIESNSKRINVSELKQEIYWVEGHDIQVAVFRPDEYTASFSYVVPKKNSKCQSDILYHVICIGNKPGYQMEESFIFDHVELMLTLSVGCSERELQTVIKDIQKTIKRKIDESKRLK